MPAPALASIVDLLTAARASGASDLHLVPGAPPHLRISGELRAIGREPLGGDEINALLDEFMAASGLRELWQRFPARVRELDAGITVEFLGRIRCNVFLDRGSPAAAIRLIPAEVPRLEELRLPPVVHRLVARPRGLLLVTGPTGHGKTTTLAALVDAINRSRRARIITIEAPIEYTFGHGRSLISQREVGQDTGSFAQALRAALRQDPDVIMVGEMRDLETISTALTAAETGHLVLATLHTNDAPQTVDRIIDAFPPGQQQQVRAQLAEALLAVVAQQLLPAERPTSDRAELAGRVVACEVLLGPMADVAATREAIRSGKTHTLYTIMETGRDLGMQTMEAALAALAAQGWISDRTAEAAATRLVALRILRQGGGTS
jgi:twitching motility protein PilT